LEVLRQGSREAELERLLTETGEDVYRLEEEKKSLLATLQLLQDELLTSEQQRDRTNNVVRN